MDVATLVRIIALACAEMLAGIFFGYRMGAYYAVQKISSSSFVQFQTSGAFPLRKVHAASAPVRPAVSRRLALYGKVTVEFGGILAGRCVRLWNRAHHCHNSWCERSPQ
jgi:hypothetical protein